MHHLFTVTTSFVVCESLKDKVLEEIRQIIAYNQKTLDHASNVKTTVTHEEIE